MSTIKSVQERRRGQYDFWAYYNNLCALRNTCPIPAIKANNLRKCILDTDNADRIRLVDWNPLIDALKINKSLRGITFTSKWKKTNKIEGIKLQCRFAHFS